MPDQGVRSHLSALTCARHRNEGGWDGRLADLCRRAVWHPPLPCRASPPQGGEITRVRTFLPRLYRFAELRGQLFGEAGKPSQSPPCGGDARQGQRGVCTAHPPRHSFWTFDEAEMREACSGYIAGASSSRHRNRGRACRTLSRPFAWAQGVRRCNRFTGSIAAAFGGTAAHPPAIPRSSASSAFR
ncbi:hypothetical protein GA0061105_108249 [Rhizobium aethiopicum]|uniref:Uncharacterized protein n=1 Tax=Rhizobium aethiopicum TaxID=1138170 RepID=A0A1C3Y5Y0_9HYPH|nr:hypothetical protein GA0061105_108249 [Rhizobium aethiopicum]